ncbi:MAG TPA: Rne/Rng family ribonuclease, partial [Actinomycetota bacterium]|nr:Rne/Rng family ribonuclease [Actinomycetota bacterium]
PAGGAVPAAAVSTAPASQAPAPPEPEAPAAAAPPAPGRAGGRSGRQRGASAATGAPAAATTPEVGTAARPERPGRVRGRGGLAAPGRGRAEAQAAAPATAEPDARAAPAEPATGGSTRLDARGRGGQGSRQADRGRRRRASGLTEEQKRVLREEGPEKRMLVTEGAERTQIGVLEGRTLVEHYVTRKAGRSLVGNVYLGRVQNVLPGMEAAFVDIGKGRNAVLYAGEVNYNEEDLDGEAPRIEKALKPGQSVLVQVTKDPIGAKGARLTAQVSLAGRYLVLQPEDNTFGISRRLPEDERSRLREILKEVRPKGLGLIVRTAAEGATADDLRADLARLQARWEAVGGKARKASAPAVIYSEPELVVRVIRDIFSPDFVELAVDAPELYERVKDYLEEVAPDLLPRLRLHDGRLPLFEERHVVEQIHKALERKVWLPSGGSIVIDRTEAMTVVDVNTGKFVGKSNLEETVVANNLEAADEIVRQLRLRDIGGIIIIDFIDMLFERNQQAVVERLRAALARDKTKSQVMEVSSLGLVQMTRKRVSGGLLESFSETCPTCEGRGVVITHET